MKSSFLLVLAAFIWGVAFVAQSVGMDYVGPFTFIGARYLIGGLVLIPCIAFLKKMGYGGTKVKSRRKKNFRPVSEAVSSVDWHSLFPAVYSRLVLCIQPWEKLDLSQLSIL